LSPVEVGRLRPYLPRLELDWIARNPDERVHELDGTLVFVDISGFTKMSERLARHGRVGAEEVTEVLGAVFAQMLAVAYANGGGLIKFGGDALLVWFAGPEHEIRGVRAAHGMRGALRSIRALDTTAGKVTLRMSVGINSGTFQFFLVGGSHRELMAVGPSATGTVHMEGTATAGEILLSRTTAAAVPQKILGERKGDGILLRSEPTGLTPFEPEADVVVENLDLLSYLPLALRPGLLAGTEPEHRAATIAFVHFDGTDELIERGSLDDAADSLEELVRDVQAAVDDLGVAFLGSDVDADGGKLILTVGVPRVLGDDEERMLLALRRILEKERRIAVRIGVNRGPVFAGDVGPPYRRTYTVMGDAVNLAARLMAKAGPGELYATSDVLDVSATRFDTTELEPFSVKGKARPVKAWSVGPAIGSRRRDAESRRYPLLGRADELGVLLDAAASATAGRGRFVDLAGEAGIGKTRLMEEMRERVSGLTVFHATADAYRAATPYSVWRELMRQALDLAWEAPDDVVIERLLDVIARVDADLEPWLPLLAVPLDVAVEDTPEVELLAPEFRPTRLNEVVVRLLAGVLTTPTLIQVEDAHLLDEASADLLTAVRRDIADRPWVVAALSRTEHPGRRAPADHDDVVRCHLAPLAPEHVAELAHMAAERESTPLLPHDIHVAAERSAGNPQFLLDLVLAIAAGSTLPDSVESAAAAAIDRLAPADRVLVRRASVLGITFQAESLDEVLDADAPRPTEETWVRLGEFFDADGEGYVRFRRAIVRDAAYAGLPFRLRRALHRAVADRLVADLDEEADEAAGILSLHFALAGDHERAWYFGVIAGRRAASSYANIEAATMYERAIDAGRRAGVAPSVLVDAAELRGDALVLAGDYRRAAAAYASARKLAVDDRVREAGLILKRARVEDRLGRYSQALTWLTRGRKALEGVDGIEAAMLRARIGAWYGTVLQAEGRYPEALRVSISAERDAEAVGDEEARAQALNARFFIALATGEPVEPFLVGALRIYRELGDLAGEAKILHNLGVGAYFAGRWDEALEYFRQGKQACVTIGDTVGAAGTADAIGEVLADQGSLDEAETQLRGSLRIWKAAGDGLAYANCLRVLGTALLRAGRLKEALQHLESARDAFVEIGAQGEAAGTDAKIAEYHVAIGDAEVAIALVARTLRTSPSDATSPEAPLLHRVRAYALAQLRDVGAAREAFLESLNAGRARGAEHEVALTLMSLLRLDAMEGRSRDQALADEAHALVQRLDMVAVPAMPLVAGAPEI
jgi:class 3 adenylate cyclase/tetratricopeptide (TPR) repeat protein